MTQATGQRGIGGVLPTPLWYRWGNGPREGRGLAQAHTAGPCGSSLRVLGPSPTLPGCKDPEEILKGTVFSHTEVVQPRWGGVAAKDGTEQKDVVQVRLGWGLGIILNLRHFLGHLGS